MSGRSPRWIKETVFLVQISGAFSSNNAYAEIDGTKYTAETTVQAPRHCSASVTVGAGTYATKFCQVTLNGEVVFNGEGTYTFAIDSDTVILFELHSNGDTSSHKGYSCSITTK